MSKIIIKDGVRYPEAFAVRHGLEGEAREASAERVRTTSAVGHFPAGDGGEGLITSAEDPASGANAETNPDGSVKLTPAEKQAAEDARAAKEAKEAEEKSAAEKAAASDKVAGKTAAAKAK